MTTNTTSQSTGQVANDIRDIKPPMEIPSGLEWLWWGLAALATIVIAWLIWRWLRKQKSVVPIVPQIPAHVRAKQKLEEALALLSQPKPFCIAVSDTVRTYLEERFTFHAPERTTEEFLYELQNTDLLLPDQKESLGAFLQSCDLVKFAKLRPDPKEAEAAQVSAVKFVEQTRPRKEE